MVELLVQPGHRRREEPAIEVHRRARQAEQQLDAGRGPARRLEEREERALGLGDRHAALDGLREQPVTAAVHHRHLKREGDLVVVAGRHEALAPRGERLDGEVGDARGVLEDHVAHRVEAGGLEVDPEQHPLARRALGRERRALGDDVPVDHDAPPTTFAGTNSDPSVKGSGHGIQTIVSALSNGQPSSSGAPTYGG